MTGLEFPDPDQFSGGPEALINTIHEPIDISAKLFAQSTAEARDVIPLHQKDGFDRVTGHMWAVDDWLFSEVRMAPMLFRVEPHHLQDAGSILNIGRAIRGEHRVVFETGASIVTRSDVLDFGDRQTQYKSISSDQVTQDLTFPRAALGIPNGQAISLPSIYKASSAGRLVFSEWNDLFESLRRGEHGLKRAQLFRFAACLKIALGVPPQREDVRRHVRQALFRQICLFIEYNLERADLSAAMLLERFGVSRATLYRMFEPLGGVRNYLTYRRAIAALFDLSDEKAERGFVRRVCDRWQFSSPTNFNRKIQVLFGNSPGALLGLGARSRVRDPESSPFKKTFISARYDLGASDEPAAA